MEYLQNFLFCLEIRKKLFPHLLLLKVGGQHLHNIVLKKDLKFRKNYRYSVVTTRQPPFHSNETSKDKLSKI